MDRLRGAQRSAQSLQSKRSPRDEKGSDVSLGVHWVRDAHMGRFDDAVVITNDSDLTEPLPIVQDAKMPHAAKPEAK